MFAHKPLMGSLDAERIITLAQHGVQAETIGLSEHGRPIHGCMVGDPDLPLVSIVAGAHPDEPAGPLAAVELLRGFNASPLREHCRLAVVPILDIDGTVQQADWLHPWDGAMDLRRNLAARLRRKPGADREFGWPGAPWGGTVLPECRAADDFLNDQGPAIAHLSLHGMFISSGAWFLLDRLALKDAQLWTDLQALASDAGFGLHDMPRNGDKGFRRAGPGFCTTPSGPAMRRWALTQSDPRLASGFGYGSMDAARARAQRFDEPLPLCAVSEFPLMQFQNSYGASLQELKALGGKLALAASENTINAQWLQEHGLEAVQLDVVVTAMVGMCEAVIRSALRQRGLSTA